MGSLFYVLPYLIKNMTTTNPTTKLTKATATPKAKEEVGTRIRIKIRAYDNRIIDQATKALATAKDWQQDRIEVATAE